jgi:hypothetical protein
MVGWFDEYENSLNISLDLPILEHVFRCPSLSYTAVSFWDECWFRTPCIKFLFSTSILLNLSVAKVLLSEIWVVSLIFDYVFFYLFNWLLEVVDIMSLLFLMWFRDLSMMFWKDNNKLSSLMIPKFVLQFLWKWIEHSSHAKLNLISLLQGAIWYTLVLKDDASTKNLVMRL